MTSWYGDHSGAWRLVLMTSTTGAFGRLLVTGVVLLVRSAGSWGVSTGRSPLRPPPGQRLGGRVALGAVDETEHTGRLAALHEGV